MWCPSPTPHPPTLLLGFPYSQTGGQLSSSGLERVLHVCGRRSRLRKQQQRPEGTSASLGGGGKDTWMEAPPPPEDVHVLLAVVEDTGCKQTQAGPRLETRPHQHQLISLYTTSASMRRMHRVCCTRCMLGGLVRVCLDSRGRASLLEVKGGSWSSSPVKADV